ncbi:YybS family protein [Pelotomaculum propionicicum]|uniref:DUF2232 domain-containing protein n=1 Tax=Pelotomaculum propionicicum TaxID=258475 RepID=A0A4Y7RZH9_9FIRM|nr:YybS family protein [Pelotomaculum propionicicum]NLI11474.1 YybS family protein [Peptococcaceae bacterium]TEB13687.1 hypothetical protein Pmgp_00090 [Pelotomaculum propionicicum]
MTTGEKTAALAQWAFFTSLVIVVGLGGIYLPPLYFIAAVLLPLPVMMLVLRLDLRYAALGLLVGALFLGILINSHLEADLFVLKFGLLGVCYGLLFKNRVAPGKSLAAGILCSVALTLIFAAGFYFLTGNNPFVLGEEGLQAAEQWLAANQSAGLFNDLPAEWQSSFGESVVATFELLLPGQYVVTAAIEAACAFLLAVAWLRRVNYFTSAPPAFTALSLPWYSVWGLITGLALTLGGDLFSWTLAAKTGKNILFVLFYLYLILGLSVFIYFFRKVNLAKPIKISILILAVVYLPFSLMIILLLGVVDPLVNLRRLKP